MKHPPQYPGAFPALFLLLATFFSGACSRTKEEAGTYRVIDRIGAKNVVASPLRNPDPKNASLMEIAGNFGMNELGMGENPYGIKMRMHFGPSDVGALAAVPPTTIALGLKIPPGARFQFGFGIRGDREHEQAKGDGMAAEFAVLISAGGHEEAAFRRTVRLRPNRGFTLDSGSIDLSRFAGREVAFRLVTDGDERAMAFWVNPVVYVPRSDARFVVLISLDTLRADHLACYGYERDTSPNIDLLARDGVRFAETRAPSPWTLPSHVSMMTGLDTINHGVMGADRRTDPLIPMLAELLKAKDFCSAAFTGGGLVHEGFGFDRGFDSYETVASIGIGNAAVRICEKASSWLERHTDRDAFLFIHTYQTHYPYRARAPWGGRYAREGAKASLAKIRDFRERYTPLSEEETRDIVDLYDGAIRYADESLIAPLVAKLKALEIYDRTMIVLTSDHGEEFYEHGSWLHASTLYEEVLRVPLVIKFFGSRNAGKVLRTPSFGVDVMPTIAEELGLGLAPESLDGVSLRRLADGGDSAARGTARSGISDIYHHVKGDYILGKTSLLRDPYAFIRNELPTLEDLTAFRTPPPPLADIELYDVAGDPDETRNLAKEKPELVREFLALLREKYRPRKKPGAAKVELGEDLIKELKTLGYL
jgi:arylsulfatase A-like enzyme